MALAVPLSRFTSRVGGGSAFFVRRIMRSILLSIICALLVGCSTTPKSSVIVSQPTVIQQPVVSADPIDQLVARLSVPRWEPWNVGPATSVGVPETASPEDVIRKYMGMGMPTGEVRNYKILEIREVHIPNSVTNPALPHYDTCTAALLTKDSGREIVIFYWNRSGWWIRYYDL